MKWTQDPNRQICPARRLKTFTRNVLVNVLMYQLSVAAHSQVKCRGDWSS